MRTIRCWVYRFGFRPRLGSIFHSPSLNMTAGFNMAEVLDKSFNNKKEKQ